MDGVNNVGGDAGLSLYFKLPAPGEEGKAFTNLATDINGVPIGESGAAKTLAIHLGFSDKDTIGSALDEVNAIASVLNMTFVNQADFEQSLQVYLDNVDPANPTIAPVRALLVASDKDLQSGNIGGVDITTRKKILSGNTGISDADVAGYNSTKVVTGDIYVNVRNALNDNLEKLDQANTDIASDIDASRNLNSDPGVQMKFSTTVGGNPWLAGNVYVAFLISFMDLQRLMMENKVVQGQIELASMNMITELAKSAADAIMAIAKTNQMIHIATAAMSAASICISVGAMIGGGIAAARPATPKTTNQIMDGPNGSSIQKVEVKGPDGKPVMQAPKFAYLTEANWNSVGLMAPQGEKTGTAAMQAATDISIAQKEGLKEMINSYKTIAERQMSKSAEIFKDNTDAITKLLADLDKIRSDLAQAVAAALRK